jgi:HEPN domain-containing protein
MKPITAEWVRKAEGDLEAALKTYRARKIPVYDAACYHCQQCAEKYLKAKLVEAGIVYTKTHDLQSLLKLILPVEPGWLALDPQLDALNKFAVAYRYIPATTQLKQMQNKPSRIAAPCAASFAKHSAFRFSRKNEFTRKVSARASRYSFHWLSSQRNFVLPGPYRIAERSRQNAQAEGPLCIDAQKSGCGCS